MPTPAPPATPTRLDPSSSRVIRTLVQGLVSLLPSVPLILNTHPGPLGSAGIASTAYFIVAVIQNALESAGILPALLRTTTPLPVITAGVDPVLVARVEKLEALAPMVANTLDEVSGIVNALPKQPPAPPESSPVPPAVDVTDLSTEGGGTVMWPPSVTWPAGPPTLTTLPPTLTTPPPPPFVGLPTAAPPLPSEPPPTPVPEPPVLPVPDAAPPPPESLAARVPQAAGNPVPDPVPDPASPFVDPIALVPAPDVAPVPDSAASLAAAFAAAHPAP